MSFTTRLLISVLLLHSKVWRIHCMSHPCESLSVFSRVGKHGNFYQLKYARVGARFESDQIVYFSCDDDDLFPQKDAKHVSLGDKMTDRDLTSRKL